MRSFFTRAASEARDRVDGFIGREASAQAKALSAVWGDESEGGAEGEDDAPGTAGAISTGRREPFFLEGDER